VISIRKIVGNIVLGEVEGWINYVYTTNGDSCHHSQGWAPATNMLTGNFDGMKI